jgi:hypothetical protein
MCKDEENANQKRRLFLKTFVGGALGVGTLFAAASPFTKAAQEREKKTCPTCKGSGQVKGECAMCKGTGKSETGNTCQSCGGSGKRYKFCKTCDGTGKVDSVRSEHFIEGGYGVEIELGRHRISAQKSKVL